MVLDDICFYRMSHHIMAPSAPGRPPRPTNQEVLEAQDDHTENVTSVSQRVVEMCKEDLESGLFEVGSAHLALMENMIVESQNTVQYKWKKKGRIRHAQ